MSEQKTTSKGNSYWASNGAYSTEMDKLWDELVPSSGEADTVHGEMVRAFGRLNYEFGNNGNCNAIEVEMETEYYGCYNCSGTGEVEEYVDCSECNGDGHDDNGDECIECCGDGQVEESVTCEECCGSGEESEEVEGDISITEHYQTFLDFLSEHLPDSSSVDALEEFLLDGNKGYSNYTFDEDEMAIYNAVGDAVGHFVTTTENKSRVKSGMYGTL